MCRESANVSNASRFDAASQSPRKPVGRMSEWGRAIVASQPQSNSAPLTPRVPQVFEDLSRGGRPQLGLRNRKSHSISVSPAILQPGVQREGSTRSAPASLLSSRAPSSEGVRASSARPHPHLHRNSVGLPSIFKIPGHLLPQPPPHEREHLDKDINDSSMDALSPDSSLVSALDAKFACKEPSGVRRAPVGVTAARARCLGVRPGRKTLSETTQREAATEIWKKSSWPSQCRSPLAPNVDTFSHKNAVLTSVAEDANDRPYMEDGHVVSDVLPFAGNAGRWGLFAVFDGHGGRTAVQHCQDRFHNLVASELAAHQKPDRNTVRGSLTRTFAKVDEELSNLGCSRSGCTATAALVRHMPQGEVELHMANVGDSRALLVGSFGTKRLTLDHRVTDPTEAARVRRLGGFICNNRVGGSLSVTRSLGDHYLKPGVSCEPDVSTHICGSRDEGVALVIASDGLWDSVEDDEVNEVLTDHLGAVAGVPDEQKAAALTDLQASVANTLVERAKAHGSGDNILVLVAFF